MDEVEQMKYHGLTMNTRCAMIIVTSAIFTIGWNGKSAIDDKGEQNPKWLHCTTLPHQCRL